MARVVSPARRTAYGLLAASARRLTPLRVLVDAAILAAIAASVGGAMLETLPDLPEIRTWTPVLDWFAAAVFTVEFAGRVWSAPESGEPHARRAYLLSLQGAVDLIAVLPAWAALVAPVGREAFEIVGVLTLLKLARYLPALGLVGAVLRNEARPLFAAATAMAVMLVIVSTVMYVIEREAQPATFRSIPHSLWWGIVTMATVGYGDMAPVTGLGKLFGGLTMLLGVASFAVPAGILATGFAEELRRRDFVVTWNMVSRVPLFQGLDAARIAVIARLLKPQLVPAHSLIARRGDAADAMFFIASGAVEIDVAPQPVVLKTGDFFGEMALLREARRSATVIAAEETRLLVLEATDFRRLLRDHPDIGQAIERVAADRGGTPTA